MGSDSKDFDESVMKELECPVCLEYMKPPISMCENGHSICKVCKQKLNNCPFCRHPFLQVRNLALESLSTAFLIQNRSCKDSNSTPENYKCPFAAISNEDCSWVGSCKDMKNHVKVCHSAGNDTHESNGRFNVVLTDLSLECHYRKVVWIGKELFYVVWEVGTDSFFCIVLYVGPKKNSSKFRYRFSLTTENGMKNISMCFQTRSVVLDMDQVLTHGECVSLHYDTVLKFLNSDKCLCCDFEINPIETVSPVDKTQSKPEPSRPLKSDAGCTTVKREFLRHETSPVKREFLDPRDNIPPDVTSRFRRGGRRGRGGPSRFGETDRRGASNRVVVPNSRCDSGVRDFQRNRGCLAKQAKKGRSLSNLCDETHYQVENEEILAAGRSRNRVQVNALKVNSSTSAPAKEAQSDKVRQNYSKGRSPILAGMISLRSDGLVSSALGKLQNKLQVNLTRAKSMSNLSALIGAQNDQLTSASESGKSQHKLQANDPRPKSPDLPSVKGMHCDEISSVSSSDKSQDKFESVYPKLKFSYVSTLDDNQMTDVSPFDTLHDLVLTNDREVTSSKVSDIKDSHSTLSTSPPPDLVSVNNGQGTLTSSEGTWKCSMCGHFAPKKETYSNLPLLDIAPPGTNWKCKLCGQWRL